MNVLKLFAPLAVTLSLGCTPTPPPEPAAPRPPAPPPPTQELVDTNWGRFRSVRHGLSVPLPDGRAWRIDDHSSSWLVARHPASGSLFKARVWHEPALANRDRCEESARREAIDLPSTDESELIDDRPATDVPSPGFDTHLRAGIVLGDRVDGLHGFVVAYGASRRKCVALVFTTSMKGGPFAKLGERLELGSRVVEGVVLSGHTGPDFRVPFQR